ncbi:hypothetical protein PFISCL1PPCAC_17041, partial [Pristionchus fissidentatus]
NARLLNCHLKAVHVQPLLLNLPSQALCKIFSNLGFVDRMKSRVCKKIVEIEEQDGMVENLEQLGYIQVEDKNDCIEIRIYLFPRGRVFSLTSNQCLTMMRRLQQTFCVKKIWIRINHTNSIDISTMFSFLPKITDDVIIEDHRYYKERILSADLFLDFLVRSKQASFVQVGTPIDINHEQLVKL